MNSEPALICPHVVKVRTEATFICRVQDGYVVSCSETCPSLSSGLGLKTAHLGHFSILPDLPSDALALPINTCVRYCHGAWEFEVYPDDSDPLEGEFRLASIENFDPKLLPSARFKVFLLANEQPVIAHLDDGFKVIPVWRETADIPAEFLDILDSTEKMCVIELNTLFGLVRRSGVRYLCIDFLCDQVDFGVIVPSA